MTQPHSTEPHRWTATESLAMLRARRISAVELLQHHLGRLDRLDRDVGAVVASDTESAMQAARDIDARRAAGTLQAALAGLPMTVKDSFETTDLPTTCGIPALQGYRAPRDADAVDQLRAAGAVIWGKTNTPLAASDHQSYNPLHGVTRNPWDASRTVGGSSGGAAAALAAGYTALELGSDIGGSIRVPAHYCGVYGHKPSYGIVPTRGHIPPMPGERVAAPLAVVGPLARSAEDLALAMSVLARATPDEAAAWQLHLPASNRQRLADVRVGLWLDAYPVDTAYAAAIERFAQALSREGVQLRTLARPPVDATAAWHCYLDLLFGVIGQGFLDTERAALQALAQQAPAGGLAGRLDRAAGQSLAAWSAGARQQAALRADWAQCFEQVDVVLCPVSMGAAFGHQTDDGFGVLPQLQRVLPVSGRDEPYLHNLMWPGLATLAHLPSTVRPLPERLGGLPLGVQIIGPYLHDRRTIEFARLCDEAFGPAAPLARD